MFRIPNERKDLRDEIARLRHENEVQAAQMERDRQWRLRSLPALLDAEARAKRAEARVAELEAGIVRTIPSPGRES